jgi:pilus assembly protein CpaC
MHTTIRLHWRSLLLAVLLMAVPCTLHADPCSSNDPTRCRIDIELHKSLVKHTDRPITRISIANPEIADYHLVTPTQILLISKQKIGSTNLIVWYDEENIDVFEIRVFVPGDLIQSIQTALHTIAPTADIHIRQSPGGVMLYGEVDGQETLDTVLKVVSSHVQTYTNLISIRGSQQVQLSVRIAEVSRSGLKKMGLGFLTNRDWSIGLFSSGIAEGSATAANLDGLSSSSLESNLELNSPFASAFQLALHSLNDDFMAILSVLKQQNLARLLATPTLVTMSGQEANFLVGGEFPVPVQGNNNQTTVQYKTFGIMLRFTPMVVGGETITIQVEPEISNVDFSLAVVSGGVGVPGLRTRRGSTTLQLKDGQTFVMAGLLQEDLSTVTSKVPFLGDIPYLGALFTSKEFQKNESELMIIVTPRLVRALNPDEVPRLPGEDGMGVVSDTDFFLKNRTVPISDGGRPAEAIAETPLEEQTMASQEINGTAGRMEVAAPATDRPANPIPPSSTEPVQRHTGTGAEPQGRLQFSSDDKPSTTPETIGGSGFAQ